MSVRVTGFGNALSMDFEEVLVSADVMYHMIQRALCSVRRLFQKRDSVDNIVLTINFGETGALRASAIS